MRHVWVIGSGGLLGRSLIHLLKEGGDALFIPQQRLTWSDEAHLTAQLAAGVAAFSRCIGPNDSWEVYWAAGIGTFTSAASDMARETAALEAFLQFLTENPRLQSVPGAIGFASSAGALYAGTSDEVVTEDSVIAPTTPYATAKLQQERLVRAYTARHDGVFSLLARMSTLYGTGQSSGKKQGLLAHIARSIVRNTPIQIFVPFDTIRDYLTASDAAARMVMALRQGKDPSRCLMQLVASEHPTTIAEILATFKRISRRTPLVVTSISRSTALYTRRVQFRSIVDTHEQHLPHTSLLVGIGQLMQAERFQFAHPSA